MIIMKSFSSQNPILIESPEGGQIGQKWAKIRQFYKLCLISQKVFGKVSSNHTRWRLTMTSFYSQSAILAESPKGGQIGQKFVKICQFYKLCLLPRKLFDKFSFHRTKWILIMISFSSQKAILIESPEGGQIGQKWSKVCQFYKLCLITGKPCDKFSFNRTNWMLIMKSFSS